MANNCSNSPSDCDVFGIPGSSVLTSVARIESFEKPRVQFQAQSEGIYHILAEIVRRFPQQDLNSNVGRRLLQTCDNVSIRHTVTARKYQRLGPCVIQ